MDRILPNIATSFRDVAAVDVFCGAGGLSLGLKEAGVRVVAGIDLDPACRFPYETNVGATFIEADVARVTGEQIREFFQGAEVSLLAGCAPCQPFSRYTAKRREIDDRWSLLLEFGRLVAESKPDIVTLENVAQLARIPIWAEFVEGLIGEGYQVDWSVLDASQYGVPQARKRLVLVASKLGELKLPPPLEGGRPTVREAIGALREIAAGEVDQNDHLHTSRALSDRNLERIKASKPAGSWKDWPSELRAACHTRQNGKTYGSVYGRMSWDKPAPTITTQFFGFGNGRFGHPDQDRAISLREGAILQSFPISFEFVEPGAAISSQELGRLIGNAVPPRLAQEIGATILHHAASSSSDSGGAR